MVDDFIRTGTKVMEQSPDAELFLVPRVPFDSLLHDLNGTPAYRISEELNRPVWLVDPHGGIDPLLSTRLVARRSSSIASLQKPCGVSTRRDSKTRGLKTDLTSLPPFQLKAPMSLWIERL